MPELLNLIEALTAHINAGNIESAITFVEKMITLVESLKPAAVTSVPAQNITQ